jgi:hypothetical protein
VLDDGYLSGVESIDFFSIYVGANHVMTEGGETGGRRESDVSGADYCDASHGVDGIRAEKTPALDDELADSSFVSVRGWLRPRRARVAELVATVLFTAWIAKPFLDPRRYVIGFDTLAYSGPNLRVTLDQYRDGHVALWNDRIFGGAPHLGNAQAGALYPLKLLVLPFNVNRGLDMLVALHLFLFALGLWYLVARRLRLTPPAAFVAAAVAVGSGVVAARSLQFEQMLVMAWVPLLLATIHAVLLGRSPRRWAAACALVVAAMLTAGHPQTVYILVPLAAAWTLGLLIDGRVWRRMAWLVPAVAVGAVIALPQLVALAVSTRNSALTAGRTREELRTFGFSVQPGYLLRVLFGNLRTTGADVNAAGFETVGYVGVAAMSLAVIGLVATVVRRRLRWTAVLLAVTAVLSVVFALGPRTFVFNVAYDHVPGFDQGRVSARWLTTAVIAIAVLAGLAVDVLRRRRVGRIAVATVGVAGLTVVIIAATGVADVPGRRVAISWVIVGAVVMAAVVATRRYPTARATSFALGAAVVMVVIELAVPARRDFATKLAGATSFTSYESTTAHYLADQPGRVLSLTRDELGNSSYLVAGLRPNVNAALGIRSVDGYDGGVQVTKRWAAMVGQLIARPNLDLTLRAQFPLPLSPARASRLAVHYVIWDPRDGAAADKLPGWGDPVAYDERFEVYENPAWLGSAVVWSAARSVSDEDAAATVLRDQLISLSTTAIVEHAPEISCATDCAPVGAPIERRADGDIVVRPSSNASAVVQVDEQYDSDWHVRVDGVLTRTVAVDGFWLGVEVPPGDHVVHFRYAPSWWKPTWLLALAALGVTIVVLVWPARRRARSGPATGEPVDDGLEPLDVPAPTGG